MDLSKLQIVALCVITTILTNKFLVDKTIITNNQLPTQTANLTTPSQPPTASVSSTLVAGINSQNETILKELINLRKDMATTLNDLKKENSNVDIATTLSSSLLNGMVKISSPQWKRIDVYEKPMTSSKIINSLVYDIVYFYMQKQDGWYQIQFDSGQTGWSQSQFLKEFP